MMPDSLMAVQAQQAQASSLAAAVAKKPWWKNAEDVIAPPTLSQGNQASLSSLGQQWNQAMAQGDVASAQALHVRANQIRNVAGLWGGADYNLASGAMTPQGQKLVPTSMAPSMGNLQASNTPALQLARATAKPSTPWWKNALGAVGKFNDIVAGSAGGVTDAETQAYAKQAKNAPGLSPAQQLYYQKLAQGAPDNAGAQMVQNSPLASGAARVVGGLLPWVAAGAGAPGVGADTAGLGAEDMGNLPLWQQIAGMAGRGVAQGGGASVLQGIDPTSRQGLQNEALGAGMETGAGLVGKVGNALNLPAILSRPVGGVVGGAAGTAAGYLAMTAQEKQNFGKALVNQGLTMGAVELVMTALGGQSAFARPDGEATPTELQQTQQGGAGAEQAPVQADSLQTSVTENIKSVIDDLEPAEKEALSTAVANNDADGALGIVAGKMAEDLPPKVNSGGAQVPDSKLILTLKAILSGDEQPARIGGVQASSMAPETDVISKLKAIDQGTYANPTLQQNNEVIAKLKAIIDSGHAHNVVQNAASQTVQQSQDDRAPAPRQNAQQWAADMKARGASQNVPGDPTAQVGTPPAAEPVSLGKMGFNPANAPDQVAPRGSIKSMIGGVGAANPKDLLRQSLALPTKETPPEAEPTMDENVRAQKLALAQQEKLKAQDEVSRRQQALKDNPNPPDTRDTIKNKTDPKSVTAGERIRKAYTATVDTKARIGQAMKSLNTYIGREAPGMKLSDNDNVALVAYNLVGTDNIINTIISKNLVDPNGNTIGKSLNDVISAVKPGDIDDLEEYMKARHAPSWLEKGRQVYPASKGITPDAEGADVARAIEAKQLAQHPYFEQIGKDWDQWQQQLTQSWLGDTGYLNQKVLDAWHEQFPHYIHRQVEQAPAERSSYTIGNRGRGSTRNTYSFIDAAVDDANHIVNKVRQNSVYAAMLRTAQVYPEWANSGWYRIDESDEGGLAKDSQEKLANPETAMDEVAAPLPEDAKDQNGQPIVAKHGNTVVARVNGKSIAMKVDDPEYLKAMRNLRPAYMGDFFKAAARITSVFKQVTVSDNPYFMLIKHPAYDIPAALITSKTLSAFNPVDYIRGPFDIMQAAVDVFRGQVMGKDNERYDTYRAVGGGRSLPSGGSDSSLARVRDDIVPGEWYEKPLKAASHVVNKAGGFIKNIDSVMATAPRLAEFKRWRAIDDTPAGRQRALYEANDVSVNYGKSGNIGKQADAVLPFLNVAIQGVDKVARTLKDDPVNAIGKAAVMLTLPTIALWLKNHGNANYQKLSQYIKDHYYCIPTPADGGKTFIKIVKPRGWGVLFSTAPEHILEAIASKNAKDLTNWGGAFAQYFMMADTQLNVAPFYQAAYNKSYTGAPIVSSKLSALSPGQQYDQNDTWIAKEIGKKMNWSPKKIDYLIQSYAGIFSQATTPGQTLQRNVIADPFYSNDIETNFYNLRTQLDQASADFTAKGVKSKYYLPELTKTIDTAATQADAIAKDKSLTSDQARQQQQDIWQQAIQAGQAELASPQAYASQEQAYAQGEAQKAQKTQAESAAESALAKALDSGNTKALGLALQQGAKAGIWRTATEKTDAVKTAREKIAKESMSPVGQQFLSMSKTQRMQFMKGLTSQQKTMLRSDLVSYTRATMSSSRSGGNGGTIQQAMQVTGVPQGWGPDLAWLAQAESAGDPTARNNSGATGLMQTKPATFLAYAVSGMNDINNPVDNAVAAIRYIQARYGSIQNIPGIGQYPWPGY
jgi:hypothetical protein